MQRQYVDAFTCLLVVFTSIELQKGHALGATLASEGCVSMRLAISAPPIVSLPEPVFGYPLIADGPEVEVLIAPTP